jgi:MEMO1 family protein
VSDSRPLARALSPSPVDIDGETYIALHDPWGVAPEGLAVPMALYALLALCDGERTLEDIQVQLVIDCGGFVASADVEAALDELRRHALLEGPEVERLLGERLEAYHRAERPAVHADQVYPGNAGLLADYLDGMLARAAEATLRPGARALVAPHIDFERGGEGYGAAYDAARQAIEADTFVVLGVCHEPADGLFTLTRQAFATPLGAVEVELEAYERLLAAAGPCCAADELLHLGEHSVEFQALFLRRLFPEARIVPVLCSHLDAGDAQALATAHRFAHELRMLLSRPDRHTALVVAADLSHVGPEFGHPKRAEKAVRSWAREVDEAVLSAAVSGDPEGVLAACDRESPTKEMPNVCGQSALYVAARALMPCTGEVLHLGQAPTPSGDSWVGFGAALLYSDLG